MRNITPQDPFRVGPDPLPHFAPFFLDPDLLTTWDSVNARRAERGELFAPPDTGFHHNPLESDVSYLYVAASPNFPGEVKIGMSKNRPNTRLKDAPWDTAFRKDPDVRISAFVMMKNVRAVQMESAVHNLLGSVRSESLFGEREWFKLDAAEALSAIEMAARHYKSPKMIDRMATLILHGENPSHIHILKDIRPDLVSSDVRFFEPEIGRDVPVTTTTKYLFKKRVISGYEKTGSGSRFPVVFIPVLPAPDKYLWRNAGDLLVMRSRLMGEVWPNGILPGWAGHLSHLDVSRPEDVLLLQNRHVPAMISTDGEVDLSFSLGSGPHGHINMSHPFLWETDLVGSDLMREISAAYWDIREGLSRLVPETHEPVHSDQRDLYLHLMSAFLVAAEPSELDPRTAQIFHGAACRMAETPIDLCACPASICELAAPILRRARGVHAENLSAEAAPAV